MKTEKIERYSSAISNSEKHQEHSCTSRQDLKKDKGCIRRQEEEEEEKEEEEEEEKEEKEEEEEEEKEKEEEEEDNIH